jgi:hypothetical protein
MPGARRGDFVGAEGPLAGSGAPKEGEAFIKRSVAASTNFQAGGELLQAKYLRPATRQYLPRVPHGAFVEL